jgi:putative MATE family efflux protein
MDNKQTIEMFHSMPVSKAVLKNTIPAMIAMLMVLVYNLADTFFIGQTDDALQVAAVSLATPVFLMFMAIGTIFGVGGTSVISRALGEGRTEYAKKVCSFCMWGSVIVGVAMSGLFLIFIDTILQWIGASSNTWEYAKTYLMIVSLSGPFVLIGNCYSNILRAEGKSGKAMMGMLIGNFANIILDPIMILVFGWNIAGAAIATVVGNILGAVYYILYFVRGKSVLSIHLRDFTATEKVFVSVFSIGVPASLATILMSVSSIILNSQMSDYGDMAVAGIGVAMKVVIISGMITMGLGQGVQALLGYCVGAKLWERYKKIVKFSICFGLVLSLVMTLVSYVLTEQIVSAFLTDPNVFDYAVNFARILLSTSVLFGAFYVLSNALQSMGAATASLIINISRQGLIYIPLMFILQSTLGVTGLVWAQPVADILSIGIAAVLYIKTLKKMMA